MINRVRRRFAHEQCSFSPGCDGFVNPVGGVTVPTVPASAGCAQRYGGLAQFARSRRLRQYRRFPGRCEAKAVTGDGATEQFRRCPMGRLFLILRSVAERTRPVAIGRSRASRPLEVARVGRPIAVVRAVVWVSEELAVVFFS